MTELELALRILLSVAFGALVGIERQWHHKNAGLKTNTLVAVGATAFALVSEHGFGPNSNPAQVAAGVVTGIGFIGGGVIMRRGASVQGINSAATLWATASMGLAIGIGYYRLAVTLLIAVLLIQFVLRSAANWIDRRSGLTALQGTYELIVRFEESARDPVYLAWTNFSAQEGIAVVKCLERKDVDGSRTLQASVCVPASSNNELARFSTNLSGIGGVTSAQWRQEEAGEKD